MIRKDYTPIEPITIEDVKKDIADNDVHIDAAYMALQVALHLGKPTKQIPVITLIAESLIATSPEGVSEFIKQHLLDEIGKMERKDPKELRERFENTLNKMAAVLKMHTDKKIPNA